MEGVNPIRSIAVRLEHDRVIAAAIAARGRRQLSGWWLYPLLFTANLIGVWQGGLASFYLVQYLPFDAMYRFGGTITLVVPALLCMALSILALALFEAINRRIFLKSMAGAGAPMELDAIYEIRPEGLKLVSDRIEIFPRWPAVDTVTRVGKDWVLQAEQLTFFVPGNSFADGDDERDFLHELRSRLSPHALERSPDLHNLT